ncbi:Outer membrane protein assembly factor BamB [Aquicella siphonis]|uniref:Outer membrane protein assembly factor BamB n=1 Tax=Aquicella siphonis TaxID=254247 RepID=A0A5E4PHC5_9COXI|nr:outer membrane protein assembly factor BamB [Aquicella siphonis]VVC76314.1 Outer membrane protein assembly factor BamB [Aquicella siphonis]
MSSPLIKTIRTIALFLVFTSSLSACAGFFEKDNTPEPTPLTSYAPEVTPRLLWSANVGAGAAGNDYLKLSPAVSETAVYTTSTSGTVTALSKTSGKRLWQVNTRLPVTTGAGAGDGLVVMGSRGGDIVALQESDGRQRWKASVPGEVIATPAVGSGIVVVKAVDGYTRALSASDGHELWSFQQVEPNMILRGSSAPLIRDRSLIVGFANGNLAKLNLDGQLLWLQTVAIPEGAFAIQRMIDIDADPVVYQHRIYVATYQGKISSLDWTSGRTLWTHDISSYTGMAADDAAVYISDAKGTVWGFGADSGFVNWRQTKLEYRVISGPAAMGNYVVVGDAQGYLHWLGKQDGHFAGRVSLGSSIYAAPIVENNVLYALTNSGYLAAYTLR